MNNLSSLLSFAWLCLFLLTQAEKPKINPFFFSKNIKVNDKASVLCSASYGLAPFTFEWLKNGRKIKYSDSLSVEIFKKYSALFIEPLSIEDTGNYTCIMSNGHGSDSFTASLIVESSPQWIKKPNDVKISVGHNVTIECKALGYPVPKIIWKKLQDSKWNEMIHIQSSNIHIFNDVMIIDKVDGSKQGNYGCQAHNGIEPSLWTKFFVQVLGNTVGIKTQSH